MASLCRIGYESFPVPVTMRTRGVAEGKVVETHPDGPSVFETERTIPVRLPSIRFKTYAYRTDYRGSILNLAENGVHDTHTFRYHTLSKRGLRPGKFILQSGR